MTKKWTVIRLSGAAYTEWGPDEPNASGNKDYLGVLDQIYHEMLSGGSQYDRPNMLLSNGKVVIDKGLSDLAWEYGSELVNAYTNARLAVNEKHNKVF